MKGIPALSIAASAVVALVAGSASADIDVEVPLALKAKGTIAGETDVYRFWAARGTVLSLKFAAAKKSTLGSIYAELHDPVDDPVEFPATTVDTGTKLQFKGLALPSTGYYRLEIGAESGVGDYTLDLKGKAKTLWKGESDITGGFVNLDLAAPPGSTAILKVVRKKGSLASPFFGIVTGGGFTADLSALGKKTDTVHVVPAGPFPDGGEIDAPMYDSGSGGFVLWQAKFKTPKVNVKKLDSRSSTLGSHAGAETMVVRPVDEEGGVVEVPDTGGSDLIGASVTIPAGALDGPTDISIASAEAPVPPDSDDQAAGPAVDLSPGGILFNADVTVTLPYDESLIPVGATAADLRVLIVEDDGTSNVVVPDSFTADPPVVTLTTNTFSVCIPIVQVGTPRLGLDPGGDEYWLIQFSAEMYPDAVGNDSRTRAAFVGVGEVSLFPDNSLQFNIHRRGWSWTNLNGSVPPIQSGLIYTTADDGDGGTATWAYGGDGQTIVLPGQAPVFRPSRDGRFLTGRSEGASETVLVGFLGVRKNTQPLYLNSLSGTWNLLLWGMDVGSGSGSGAAEPRPSRGSGTVTFDGIGGCKFAATERNATFNASNGTYSSVTQSINVTNATYTIDAVDVPGTILVTIPPGAIDESGAVLRLRPGPGCDLLVGADKDDGQEAKGFILLRQGTGMGTSSLDGAYHGAEIGVDPHVYTTGGGVDIMDFSESAEVLKGSFDGGSSASVDFFDHSVSRNPGSPGGLDNDDSGLVTPSDTFPLSVSVTPVGKMTLAAAEGSVVGAVLPGGMLAVYISNPANTGQDWGIGFLVKAPPPSP